MPVNLSNFTESDCTKRCGIQRLAILVLVLISSAVALMAQEVLTNEKIIAMTKAHLGDSLIVGTIQDNPGRYVLTSTALIALKQQGVSDEVIAAMRAKMAKKSGGEPSRHQKAEPTSEQRPSQLPRFGEWEVYAKKDEISGESHIEGFMRDRAESNGREGDFQVTATCPALGLAFKIVYLSSFDKDLGYKMEDGNFLLRRPHVVMRLSLDGNSGTAPSTTSDFKNEATLWFQRALTGAEEKNAGMIIFGGLLSLTSPAEPKDVFKAKLLKVQLPLNNGDLPILNIRPQEHGFPEFASRCKAADEDAQRKEKEQKAQADRTAATAAAERQKAAEAEMAKRRQASDLANDLKVERDLGDALLCKGAQLYKQSPTLFPYSGIQRLNGTTLIKIVGASVKDGVLWTELRVKPVIDRRWPLLNPLGLGTGEYYVATSAIQDSCPEYHPRTPGLLSGATLTQGVQAAGSLEGWTRELAVKAEESKKNLEGAAITANEFSLKLDEVLRKRGPEFGVDPSQYRAPIQRVSDIVRLCSSISAAEFASSMDQYGMPHLVRYKDGMYKDCVPTGVWRGVPEDKTVPGFLISFDLRNSWQGQQKDWDGPKLHMNVYLKETRHVTPMSIDEYERHYVLLSVDIRDGVDTAAAPPTAASVTPRVVQASDNKAVAPKAGQFVCPGAIVADVDHPKVGLSIKAPVKIVEVDPQGLSLFKLAGDDKVYFLKAGPAAQAFCSR